MDVDKNSGIIILHFITKVPNIKPSIMMFLAKKDDVLIAHIKG
jgi:hypothetical protein